MKKTFLILALFVASLNLRPAITSIAPLLETIRGELGMSSSVASLLTTLPVLCMGIFAPSAVKWVRLWGMERSLVLTLILIGAATFLRYFVVGPIYLLFTSFLVGIGIAVAGPLLSGFVKKYFADQASVVIGVYSASLVIGAAISAGLAVPLQHLFSGSWKASLAFWGFVAVAALPLWFIIARKSGERDRGRQQMSRSTAETRLPLRNTRAWLLTLFFGVVALIFYSSTAWLAPIFESMGYSKAIAGTALTLFTVIQLPCSIGFPILIKRFSNRLFWMLLLASFELSGLILLALSGNPWIIATLLGIGAGGLFPIVLLLPIEETESPDEANSWSALTQSGGFVIGSIGPLFVGMLHDYTGSYAVPVIGLILTVIFMMLIMLKVGNSKDASQQVLQIEA